MATKRIVIDISVSGEITIETHGYTGKACLEDSQFVKDLLGREVAVQLCPTYYQKGTTVVKRHVPLCG